MSQGINKAEILLEALPYMRRFYGKTIVIKYGGAAMEKAELSREFARDITLLQYAGVRPVVVHGGGPQVNRTLQELGITTEFVEGHRITDEKVMDVVEMVLAGKINKGIVALINHEGGRAVGISGKDANLARAELHGLERRGQSGQIEKVSLGRVGRVTASTINPALLRTLDESGFVPVIAPVAADENGQSLNVNADTMAGAIASALRAEKLILLTDTPGLQREGETLTRLTPTRIKELISDGTITGGMLPKVNCCLEALSNGVERTHIIDGRVPHSVLLEIFTMQGVGTLISNRVSDDE